VETAMETAEVAREMLKAWLLDVEDIIVQASPNSEIAGIADRLFKEIEQTLEQE